MTNGIAVIGDDILTDLICFIAKSSNVPCAPCHFEELYDGKLTQAEAIIFDLNTRNVEMTAEAILSLRLDLEFRGAIIVLSFAPRDLTEGRQHGPVFRNAGCALFQLPFLVGNLLKLIAGGRERLCVEALEDIRERLGAVRVCRLASVLRHDYANKFSLSLAHLRVIEKFAYFTALDPNRVMREVQRVQLHLPILKFENFRRDITQLAKVPVLASHVEHVDNPLNLEKQWSIFSNWYKLCDIAADEIDSDFSQLFETAKNLRESIENLLSFIDSLKERAQRIIDHAE